MTAYKSGTKPATMHARMTSQHFVPLVAAKHRE
jgi:hypothetical protein